MKIPFFKLTKKKTSREIIRISASSWSARTNMESKFLPMAMMMQYASIIRSPHVPTLLFWSPSRLQSSASSQECEKLQDISEDDTFRMKLNKKEKAPIAARRPRQFFIPVSMSKGRHDYYTKILDNGSFKDKMTHNLRPLAYSVADTDRSLHLVWL